MLKIDGSLIQGASDDILSRALINGLVHMRRVKHRPDGSRYRTRDGPVARNRGSWQDIGGQL